MLNPVHPRRRNAIRTSTGERIYLTVCFLVLACFFVACLLPFYLIIINSLVPAMDLSRGGFQLWPKTFSLDGYRYVLGNGKVFTNYLVSITVTVCGTALATIVTAMFAYGLAHPRVKYRYKLSFLTYIPMIMGSGLVGFYLLVVSVLHINDTLLALILPYVLSPFNTFIMVSHFRGLPYELTEAAYIDGAHDGFVFFKVVWPMSVIPTVTIMLFYALGYWNDWWLANLFITHTELKPLQILIRNIISRQQMAAIMGSSANFVMQPLTVQLVTVCITIGPILLVYPFVQKYFVQGITVGAVKG